MSAPALVTGCAGYIGTHLCEDLLATGQTVVGVDNFTYGNHSAVLHLVGHPRFRLVHCDVRDTSRLLDVASGVGVVYHLAAVVGAPACAKRPDAHEVNAGATARLARRLSRAQRLVYANTESCYGDTGGKKVIDEGAPIAPLSLYAKSKQEGEDAVLDHPRGAAVRLATVFGASARMRFDLMVNDWCREMYRRRSDPSPFEVYEPGHWRSFVHVGDAARALMFLGHVADRADGAYNVSPADGNMTKMQLALFIADMAGVDTSLVREGPGRDPDQRNYRVSSERLFKTGFRFENGLRDGVGEVLQFLGSGVDTADRTKWGNA